MAIDFLIFGLLLISFVINFLALGAFWVTPGLRTTANRFTINLLIINLIGCLILAPTLFLTGSSIQSDDTSSSGLFVRSASDDSIEFFSKPGNHQMTIRHNGKLVEQEGIILRQNASSAAEGSPAAVAAPEAHTIETIYKRNNTYYQELIIDERKDGFVITEIEERSNGQQTTAAAAADNIEPVFASPLEPKMRCWSIDLAAALGALAVLLVVGDTWCAVTDPLRYHSRISGVKSWVFIALTWSMGILFGALSAFRELNFESETVWSKEQNFTATQFSLTSSNGIFGLVFACLYFLVIILLPFGFVCGMYWRIFSEARENGLRMRQNGSSPLLQSALNLSSQQQAASLQYSNSLCVHRNSISSASSHGGGLQMQIDQRNSSPACVRRDSATKILLPTISDDGVSDDADADSTMGHLVPVPEQCGAGLADRNQNILLTLQAASGEIKRNYSARQLPLLGTSSQDLRETNRLQGIRQVHSSPNLQKYTQLRQDSLSDESCSPHLLGHHQHAHQQTAHFQRHQQRSQHIFQQHYQHHCQQAAQPTQALQIPAIHASPKALSYMSSLRHRLSNASSLFKYREESRAARISILVVIMFLVSYLPFGFLMLLQSHLAAANFEHSSQLAILMILLANLSSPFIFAYRNKRVRRGVKRLFGLDTRCRTLQRQNSCSTRGSGFLQRQSSGALKNGSVHIRRNDSKVSNYSTNSCKYLTPQNSLVSNYAAANNATLPALRPNSSCSTIINLSLANKSTESASEAKCDDNQQQQHASSNGILQTQQQLQLKPKPKLQRGITIVEQIPLHSNKFASKRSLFKMFFQSSKNLSCAAAQVCAQGGKEANEPTEV